MDLKKDFITFAHDKGVRKSFLCDYMNQTVNYINPTVPEERQSNFTAIDIYSRLLMDRILFIGQEINNETANIISAQMLWLEQQSDQDIQIYINSPGGSVTDGLQIIDTMDFISCDINTTCLGMSASMAAVIFSNGTKGKRNIIPHGRMMIHQPMGGTGNSTQCSDIQIYANQIKSLQKKLYTILKNNSNLSYKEIEKMSDRDCWLEPEECVKYGFADKIINNKNKHYV